MSKVITKPSKSVCLNFRKAFTIVVTLNLVSVDDIIQWLFHCISKNQKSSTKHLHFFLFLTLKIFLIERSIFDFMGFMFGMIIADLLYLTFLIIGLFGVYQYRVNYVAAVSYFSALQLYLWSFRGIGTHSQHMSDIEW